MNSHTERDFAIQVVERLREAGYQALWAGGCVRDLLLHRSPEDFDVATDALPEQVRALFGHRRTLAVGQAFGVIVVLGARGVSVEVATFRKDSTYSDGRHPDSVEFSTPEEDAARRDFTVNGLFYDPLGDEVVDFVGGRDDLERQVIRAIGDPHERFSEDRLRILRAVRFATTLDFSIDPGTWAAVCQRSVDVSSVSVERVTSELKKLLLSDNRAGGLRLLHESGLLAIVLPELGGQHERVQGLSEPPASGIDQVARQLDAVSECNFAIVFALLMRQAVAQSSIAELASRVARRWRLTNVERDAAMFLLNHEPLVVDAITAPWPDLQRALVNKHGSQLVAYGDAICRATGASRAGIEFCRERLKWPREKLDPPALIDGDVLAHAGIRPGPVYKRILREVRNAQLLGQLTSREDAIAFARQLAADAP